MPRLVCDVYGCGERPLLAIHDDLAHPFYSQDELTSAGVNRCIIHRHVRLCSVHSARVGIVQLVIPHFPYEYAAAPDPPPRPAARTAPRPSGGVQHVLA
jgi:hypothetical protein